MKLFVNFVSSEAFVNFWLSAGMELSLFALTCLGFLVFRSNKAQDLVARIWSIGAPMKKDDLPAKELEANFVSGHFQTVLDTWASLKHLSVGGLCAVVQSLSALNRHKDIVEALQRALKAHRELRNVDTMNAVLEAMSPGKVPLQCVSGVCQAFSEVGVRSNDVTQERLIPAVRQLSPSCAIEFLSQVADKAQWSTSTYILLARSALATKNLDHFAEYVHIMHDAGHQIPNSCLTHVLCHCAGKSFMDLNAMLKRLPNVQIHPETLAALLEQAAKTSNTQLLGAMHKKAVSEKIPLCAASYDALVKGYAAIGDARAAHIFQEMLDQQFEPSENTLVGLISICADAKDVKLAERAAEHYRQKHGQLTLAMYSALMKVYSNAKLFHKACDLYELLVQDGVKLDTVAYGCLIRAAVESGRLDLARKLFQESGNPDLINYMSLIRAAGRERNLAKALSLLGDLERSPIPIDTTAYNCVLDVCVACGDQRAAKDLFRKMRDAGHVDVISYNTYLKTLLSRNGGSPGSASDITLILQEMRSQGIKPNPVTYNSLINAGISRGDLRGAWQYVEDMEAQGVQVDAFTCSILMKGIKHSSKRDDVEKILALVDRAKVVPDEVLVNSLLDACVRLRNGPLLTQVLQQFRATGVVPSLHAYATLIKAYGHARQLDQVWALWQELTVERGITPNEEVLTCMADACAANGDLSGAVRVLRDVKHAGLGSGGHQVFCGLIRACLQRKELNHAMELYEEMDKNDITCTLTSFNMLIDALARASDMTRVARLFRDMCQKNVAPDLVTYSTVIKGYCVKGELEPAMQLFTLMRKRGIKPDGILFNSILDGCAHKQMRTLTEQVLADMEEEGVNPSNFTLSILVKLYGRCGDIDQAFDVVETYPKKYSFELNAQVYTCLMSACISNKQLPKALQVLEQMKMASCSPDGKTYQTLLNGCLKLDELEHAIKIVDDALCLDSPDGLGAHALLNQEAIDTLVFTIQRRGRMADLGDPLIQRLRHAGFAINATSKNSSSPLSRLHAARNGQRLGASNMLTKSPTSSQYYMQSPSASQCSTTCSTPASATVTPQVLHKVPKCSPSVDA